MDTLLLVLAGLLIGGTWSLARQGARWWAVALVAAAAVLSLLAALVGQ